MEYIFGRVKRNGVMVENVKTIGAEHSDLNGKVSVTAKYYDSHITDNFVALEKYRSEEGTDGKCYDWYEIKDHYRYEDKFTPGIGPAIEPVAESVNDTQDALCEASEDFDARIADIENALCELTEE